MPVWVRTGEVQLDIAVQLGETLLTTESGSTGPRRRASTASRSGASLLSRSPVGPSQSTKGKRGKAVDFLVTAVAGPQVEGSSLVSVSIELKCCWHEDLDTAMREQLVRHYLDTDNSQGIYLGAYFDGPHLE